MRLTAPPSWLAAVPVLLFERLLLLEFGLEFGLEFVCYFIKVGCKDLLVDWKARLRPEAMSTRVWNDSLG